MADAAEKPELSSIAFGERDAPTSGGVASPGLEIGDIWDRCLAVEYDRDRLVGGLAEWLGKPDGLEVLDCACGSGFPSLDLHQRGYKVTCTDASAQMLKRFRHNAAASGLTITPLQARWDELESLFPGRFDAVLCRGSSLIYAGTWDSNTDPEPSAIARSLESMARCLRPGGRLYVDSTHEEDLLLLQPNWFQHEPRAADGCQVELRERVIADPEAKLRRWTVEGSIDDVPFEMERKSYFLRHTELKELLGGAGLVDVTRVDVAGEHYAVFSGRIA